MTPEAQRIAIAEACGAEWYIYASGWTWLSIKQLKSPDWVKVSGPADPSKIVIGDTVPDYLNDYTAIIMAMRSFPVEVQGEACKLMGCHLDYAVWIDTAPSVMCECLLKALVLWDDSK